MAALIRRLGMGLTALLVVLASGWVLIGPDWRALLASPPVGRDVLFWSQAQRDAGFRMIDRVPVIIESRLVVKGEKASPIPEGEPLELGLDLEAYLASQRSASLIIVQDGRVRLER